MNITISGASGFIGRRLVKALLEEKHALRVLSRNGGTNLPPGVKLSVWHPLRGEPPADALENAHAVIHLSGEPVAQRWTDETKGIIRDSRVHGTRHLVQALSTLSRRPSVLVCASAIGIYGSRGDQVLTETSSPGSGFLPDVCVAWEKQADLAESLGIRVAKIRIGIVLDPQGGALKKMLPPFQAFVGGKLGSGRQWMSWIHLDDLVGLMRYVIGRPVRGPVNGTAPNPVTNKEFTRTLAGTLKRPALFPAPAFALKLALGEMSEILLASQRVLPKVAQEDGFRFQYPQLQPALEQLLRP